MTIQEILQGLFSYYENLSETDAACIKEMEVGDINQLIDPSEMNEPALLAGSILHLGEISCKTCKYGSNPSGSVPNVCQLCGMNKKGELLQYEPI